MSALRSCVVVAVFAISLAACGGPPHDRADDIVKTAPTGTFGGASWTMTKASISNDGTRLDVKIFGDDVADCAFSSDKTGYLLFTMPAKVAKRPLKFSFDFSDPDNQTITFVTPPSNNNIATDGILNLTELTDTSVTLGILAKAGADNVNGTLTATLCK
jgi:hypothetical protein